MPADCMTCALCLIEEQMTLKGLFYVIRCTHALATTTLRDALYGRIVVSVTSVEPTMVTPPEWCPEIREEV